MRCNCHETHCLAMVFVVDEGLLPHVKMPACGSSLPHVRMPAYAVVV